MGFVHNGGLNSHLLNYKQMITDGEETEDIAKYMMVIMINTVNDRVCSSHQI